MSETTAQAVGLGVLAALLLAVAWAKGALAGDRAHRAAADRFARRAGLPAGAVDDTLARRVVRRHRLVILGAGLGVVFGVVLGPLLGLDGVAGAGWATGYAGLALGAVADRLTGPGAGREAPRTAHARDTRVSDYVPGWLLAVVGAAVLVAAALAVAWLVTPGRPVPTVYYTDRWSLAAAVLLPAALGLAASAALVRLVLRRPQPVASPTGLAVDDALRAQALRDALHLATATAVITALAFTDGLRLLDGVPGPLRAVAGWAPPGMLVVVVVLAAWHEGVGGPAHWRRLHPDLGPGLGAEPRSAAAR